LWAVVGPGEDAAGLPRAQVERRLASSDFLLNVMGYLDDEDLLARAPLPVFLDIDPGFGQMWRELGLADPFAGHDRFVSVGLEVGGGPACEVPACGLEWIPTVPPVALDHWPAVSGGAAFTSVATWRGPYGPVEYDGRTYGLRVHEFRRFLPLPERVRAKFKLALAIDRGDAADLERLRQAGWRLVDPAAVAARPASYRRFIQASAAEFTVAKAMYVDARSGWFSDRSACYLASGKPVVAQETGFSNHLPTGEGLLAFSTVEQAAAAVEAVRDDPGRHARAAREIAEEHLDAELVLGRLIEQLGAVRTLG
jgi:glycosyltransferase involved in cell wall biosynthesis